MARKTYGGIGDETGGLDRLGADDHVANPGLDIGFDLFFAADTTADLNFKVRETRTDGGKVATEGWSKLSRHDPIDLAQRFAADGIEAIIYTDISRDGMLSGPNISATVALAQAVPVPVIASGGIANLEQVLALKAHEGDGITGAITGRAIYEGTLDFSQARAQAEA